MSYQYRSMQAQDIKPLEALWQRTIVGDPVCQQRLVMDYLLDPHFDPTSVVVSELDNVLTGFVFGMRARTDCPSDNDPDTGIVVAFGVDMAHRRQGVATALLKRLEQQWLDTGVSGIQIGPWIPTYLTPGVDATMYPEALPFLESQGYETGSQSVSMRVLLTGYVPADHIDDTALALAREGVTIEQATVLDIIPTLDFAQMHFPHWVSYVRDTFRAVVSAQPSTIHVAYRGTEVIGFALTNGERFGPFGVDESCRGKGVGAVLLSRSLCAMRACNQHVAYFMWTSDRTARLYQRHGFETVRRFTMVSKQLVSGE
ncbi:MAG: GNAT family N-acetyltransferase [Thermomicrobiales bacterium]|nr:GNAT family N-acetyltransferase [Thermomicrobiales bacterium]